jgi:hypothetical protein
VRARADFCGGPLDGILVVVGREALESFGVSRSEVEEERGCKLGRKACDGGGRGDLWRLLTGGGVPEGVEWPERRSSHILAGQQSQGAQCVEVGEMRPDRSSTAVIANPGQPGPTLPNRESALSSRFSMCCV